MRRTYPLWCLIASFAIFGPVTLRVLTWEQQQQPQPDIDLAAAGGILFNHEWQVNDPLCPDGDGLGPVFNARSCVACHHQNGIGGGGALQHNVTTFVVQDFHGTTQRQGVVHAFATDPKFQEKLTLLDPTLPDVSQPTLDQVNGHNRSAGRAPTLQVQLSQRNTPALFGAGLIDLIPDQAIVAMERQQRLNYGMAPSDTDSLPVGRARRLADGQIGRFGWKAQTAKLSEFVQAACASELGLGNPTNAQPQSMAHLSYSPRGLDLSQTQCDALTTFVAALPRPVERLPASKERTVHDGKVLFTKVGCAECHTPNLGSVNGIYSDLLLHRMGMELEASGESYGGPSQPTVPTSKPGTMTFADPLPDEWRTPPLWGVADSAPYLHDGRAATLEDAIKLHGGQGVRSAERFQNLNTREQTNMIAFLQSLRAP